MEKGVREEWESELLTREAGHRMQDTRQVLGLHSFLTHANSRCEIEWCAKPELSVPRKPVRVVAERLNCQDLLGGQALPAAVGPCPLTRLRAHPGSPGVG